MPKEFGYFCALTTKTVVPQGGGDPVVIQVAVCVKLDGTFQNNAGVAETVGIIPLEAVRNRNPRPLIEIERSYSSAARRGVFGKMAFEIEVNNDSTPDPGFGGRYKTSLVYNRELSSATVAQAISTHNWHHFVMHDLWQRAGTYLSHCSGEHCREEVEGYDSYLYLILETKCEL